MNYSQDIYYRNLSEKGGKTFRKIEYVADFQYEQDGKIIVEDVKGMETDVFKLKKKLFEYKYKDLELRIIWRIRDVLIAGGFLSAEENQ